MSGGRGVGQWGFQGVLALFPLITRSIYFLSSHINCYTDSTVIHAPPDCIIQLYSLGSVGVYTSTGVHLLAYIYWCTSTGVHLLAYIYWRTGVLAYWRTGVLAYWPTGVLAYWRTGVLAYWLTGVLAYWRTGILVYWRTGILA
jgi:hypothetical protein